MAKRKKRYAVLQKLKGELKGNNITYEEMAKRLSRSINWLNDILNGYSSATIEDAMNICEKAGIDTAEIDYFFISPNLSFRKIVVKKSTQEKK